MLEKLKDIMYDVSDILLSLVIVALIFFVVSWKISDSLAFDVQLPEKAKLTTEDTFGDIDITEVTVETGNTDSSSTAGTSEITESTEGTSGTSTATSDSGPDSTSTSDAKPGGTQVTLVGATKEIEIKSGSTGWSIGKLLQEEGLVTDSQGFIKRVEELGLGAKLRSGTFTLSTDMSLDEIIYKISGQ